MHRTILIGTGSLALTLLSACSSTPSSKTPEPERLAAANLDPSGTTPTDFQAILDDLDALNGTDELATTEDGPRVKRAQPETAARSQPEITETMGPAFVAAAPAPEGLSPAPTPAPTRDEQVAALLAQLATVLGNGEDTTAPVAAAIRLLGLELVEPESAVPELAALRDQLAPAERATVDALTTLVRALASSDDPADQAVVAAILQDAVTDLPDGDALSIPAMAICNRVDGFGAYRALPDHRFVAGRVNRMIVYVEIGGFEQQKSSSGLWQVELTQELTLIQESDGLPALHIPAEVIKDRSVRARRDFYTTRRLELPRTLAIGRYQLKVTIRDRLHGTAVAESTFPIELMANARSLRR